MNIKFNIISVDNNYSYEGKAIINRDLIIIDDEYKYIIDKTTKSISKNSGEIKLDFINNKIYLEHNKYSLDISINKCIFSDNIIDVEYTLGDNKIEIKMEVGDSNE